MSTRSQLTTTVTVTAIIPGSPPALAFSKRQRVLRDQIRFHNQTVAVFDVNLFARLQREVQSGDEIDITLVTDWGTDTYVTYLVDFTSHAAGSQKIQGSGRYDVVRDAERMASDTMDMHFTALGGRDALLHGLYAQPLDIRGTEHFTKFSVLVNDYSAFVLYPVLSPEFNDAITRAVEHDGEEYLILDGVSEGIVPMHIHEARALELRFANEWEEDYIKNVMLNRGRRSDLFKKQIMEFDTRDICPRSAINRLVDHGIYALDDDLFTYLGASVLNDEQIVDVLRNLISLLEAPKYEMGLLEDKDAELCRTFSFVKVGYGVLQEVPSVVGGKSIYINIEQREPTTVEAHRLRFEHYWSRLPAENKDKDAVREWLTRRLGDVEQRLNRPRRRQDVMKS